MDGVAESSRQARDRSASPRPSLPSDNAHDPQFTQRRSASPPVPPNGARSSLFLNRSSSPLDATMSHRSRSRSRSPAPASSPHQLDRNLSNPRNSSSPFNAQKTALHITHLTCNVGESHLRHIFEWYGKVERVYLLPRKEESRRRSGGAYVMMGSVGEAAKAALFMKGGQIDGAIVKVVPCEPPNDLPPERPPKGERERERYSGSRRHDSNYRDDDRRRSSGSYHHRHNEYDDRRGARTGRPPREWGAGGVHPDRQRNLRGDERSDVQHRPKMRTWGQPDHSASSTRRRDHSHSRSRSPRRPSPPY